MLNNSLLRGSCSTTWESCRGSGGGGEQLSPESEECLVPRPDMALPFRPPGMEEHPPQPLPLPLGRRELPSTLKEESNSRRAGAQHGDRNCQ